MHRQFTEEATEVIQKVNKYVKIGTDSLISRQVLTQMMPLLHIGTEYLVFLGRTTRVSTQCCDRGEPEK